MSRILDELNSQAQQFQARQDAINQRINNFDLEQELYNGTQTAYNMGKATLEQQIGSERFQYLEAGAPLVGALAKYGAARSGLTGALKSRFADFKSNVIDNNVNKVLSKGKETLGDFAEQGKDLVSQATERVNNIRRQIPTGEDIDGFITKTFSNRSFGGGLPQEVRQLGTRAYAQLTEAQRNALPKGSVDEDGIPYDRSLISPQDVRKGLTTGRFGYDDETGKVFDTAGRLKLGEEPDLLPAPTEGLPGGAPLSTGLTRGSFDPARGYFDPQRTAPELIDRQGIINPRYTREPGEAPLTDDELRATYRGATTQIQTDEDLPYRRLVEDEGERLFTEEGGANLRSIFAQDQASMPPRGNIEAGFQAPVEPAERIAQREARTRAFQEIGQRRPEPVDEGEPAFEPPAPAEAPQVSTTQSLRELPSLRSLTGKGKGKAPAQDFQRIPRQKPVEEQGTEADDYRSLDEPPRPVEERLADIRGEPAPQVAERPPPVAERTLQDPLTTQAGRQFERSAPVSERPNAPYGEPVETAPRRVLPQAGEQPEPEVDAGSLQQPRTLTQSITRAVRPDENVAPMRSVGTDPQPETRASEEASTQTLTKNVNIQDAEETAEREETLGGDLVKTAEKVVEGGAPEEEGAEIGAEATLPGIGEVLMGATAIAGLIHSAKESAQDTGIEQANRPQPPQGMVGGMGMGGGIAFDSAPVIDSSDYHNL